MLNLLASISWRKREVMLERQWEGVAKAKAEGKYKGRVPTFLRYERGEPRGSTVSSIISVSRWADAQGPLRRSPISAPRA